MALTLAETIREASRRHLEESGGLLMGQCVSAVGWIAGTVPNCKNIVELPMTDVAGSAFAVGAALMGKRPIFVVRYQGFMWLNSSSLVNYAAKSKELWNTPCPVFIRAIAMEGHGVGATASSSLHSLFMHAPGMPVAAPMTPGEWLEVWDYFLKNTDPVYCSEHRLSYSQSEEMVEPIESHPEITIVGISSGRLNSIRAAQKLRLLGFKVNLFHLLWLKPFQPDQLLIESIGKSRISIVIDSDNEIAGAGRSIAYELSHTIGRPVHALGIKDRTCGAAPQTENITPQSDEIIKYLLAALQRDKHEART